MTESRAQEEIAKQLIQNSVENISKPKALFKEKDINEYNVANQPFLVFDFDTVYDTTGIKARQQKIKDIRNWLLYVVALYLIYFLLYWIGLLNWLLDYEDQTDNVIGKTPTPHPADAQTVFIGFLGGFFSSSTIITIFFTDNSQQPSRRGIATKFVASFVVYGIYLIFLYGLSLIGRMKLPSLTCSIVVITGILLEICLLVFLAISGYTNKRRWAYNACLVAYIAVVYFLGCYPLENNTGVSESASPSPSHDTILSVAGVISMLVVAAIALGASILKKVFSTMKFVSSFLFQGLAGAMSLFSYIYNKLTGSSNESASESKNENNDEINDNDKNTDDDKPKKTDNDKNGDDEGGAKNKGKDSSEKDLKEMANKKAKGGNNKNKGSRKKDLKELVKNKAKGNNKNSKTRRTKRIKEPEFQYENTDFSPIENIPIVPVFRDAKTKTKTRGPSSTNPDRKPPNPKPGPRSSKPGTTKSGSSRQEKQNVDASEQRSVPVEDIVVKPVLLENAFSNSQIEERPQVEIPSNLKNVSLPVNPKLFSEAVKNSSVNFTVKSLVKSITGAVRKTFKNQNSFFTMKPGVRVTWSPPRMFRMIPEAKQAMDFLLSEQKHNMDYFYNKFLPLEETILQFASGSTTINGLEIVLHTAQSIVDDMLTASSYNFIIMDELFSQFVEFRSNNQKAVEGIKVLEALLDNDINLESQKDTIYRVQDNVLKLLGDATAIKMSAQLVYQFEVDYIFEAATQPTMVDPHLEEMENVAQQLRRGINNGQNSMRTQIADAFSSIPTTVFPETQTVTLLGSEGREYVDKNQMATQIANNFVAAAVGGGYKGPVRFAFNGEVMRKQRANEATDQRNRIRIKKAKEKLKNNKTTKNFEPNEMKSEPLYQVSNSTIENVSKSIDPAQVPLPSVTTINNPVAPNSLIDSLAAYTVEIGSIQIDSEHLDMAAYFQGNREHIFKEFEYLNRPLDRDPLFDALPSNSDEVYNYVSQSGLATAVASVVLTAYLFQKSKATGEVQALAELEDKGKQYQINTSVISETKRRISKLYSSAKKVYKNMTENGIKQSRNAVERPLREKFSPQLPFQDAKYVPGNIVKQTLAQYGEDRKKEHDQFSKTLENGLRVFRNQVSQDLNLEMDILAQQYMLANPGVSKKQAKLDLENARSGSDIQSEKEFAFLQQIHKIIANPEFKNNDLLEIVRMFINKQGQVTPFEKKTYASLNQMLMVSYTIQEISPKLVKNISDALRDFKIRINGDPLSKVGYEPRFAFQRSIRNTASCQSASFYGAKLNSFQRTKLENPDNSTEQLFYNSNVAETQMDNTRKVVETNVSQGVANDMRITAIDTIDNPLSKVPEDIRIAQYLAKQPSQDVEFKEGDKDKVKDVERRKMKIFKQRILAQRRKLQKKENILKRGKKRREKQKAEEAPKTDAEILVTKLRDDLVELEMQKREKNKQELKKIAAVLVENNKKIKLTINETNKLESLPKRERKKDTNKHLKKKLRSTLRALSVKNKKLKRSLKVLASENSESFQTRKKEIVRKYAAKQEKISKSNVREWIKNNKMAVEAIKEDSEQVKKAAKEKVQARKRENTREAMVSLRRATALEKENDKRSNGQAKQEREFAQTKMKENMYLDETLENLVEMTDKSTSMEIATIEKGNKTVLESLPSRKDIAAVVIDTLDAVERNTEQAAKRAREVVDYILPYMDEDDAEEIIEDDQMEISLQYAGGGKASTTSSGTTVYSQRSKIPTVVERNPRTVISEGRFKVKPSTYNRSKRQIIAA